MKRFVIIMMVILCLLPCFAGADTQKLEKALYDLSKKLAASFTGNQTGIFKLNISIGEIKNQSKLAGELQMGQAVREILSGIFSRSQVFAVIEREKIDAILSEQEFQLSGITDASGAVEAGRLLNAQAMLFGVIAEIGDSFVISCSLVDVETGQSITEQVSLEKEVLVEAAEKRLDMMYVQPMGIGISLSGVGITYAGNNPTMVPFPDVNDTIFRRNLSVLVRYRITGFLMAGIGLDYVYGQVYHFDNLSWDMSAMAYPNPTGTAPFNINAEGIGIPIKVAFVYAPVRWFNLSVSAGIEYFILECEGYFEPSNGFGFGINDFGPTIHSEFISFNCGLGAEVFITPRMALSLDAGYEFGVSELDTSGMWHITDMPDSVSMDISGLTLALRISVYF